jgi:two-component system cell cycle sensor histidine kinase/response regulator CckA
MGALDIPFSARGSETVLLVDADPETRKLGAFMLEKRGYRVLEARSTADALALCESGAGSVDLLLTEILMPKMTGIDLAARLRDAQPQLRVLLMSHADYKRLARQMELGPGQGFLQKPFTMRMLAGKVREILDAPRARTAAITQ